MLSVATLDDDPGVGPFEHIWVSHDAPWLKDPEDGGAARRVAS